MSSFNVVIASTLQEPVNQGVIGPPPGENPVLLIAYDPALTLSFFNSSFIDEGLTVSFMNDSKNTDVIDIYVYVNVSMVNELSGLTFNVDNGAQIRNILFDLCNDELVALNNYKELQVDAANINLQLDGNDLTSKAEDAEASAVKITVSINNWQINKVHKLAIIPDQPSGIPDNSGSSPPEQNIFVQYDAMDKKLGFFNVSAAEGGMNIFFSNASASIDTIDLFVYVGIDAIQQVSGLNTTIDKGAKILGGSVDLCTGNFTIIKNYQSFNLGTGSAFNYVSLDIDTFLQNVTQVKASFVRFRTRIGNWNGETQYTFHIQPLLREMLYYEKDGNIYVNPAALAASPEMRIWWQQYNETISSNQTYQDISWEFGPRPSYEIFCLNSSSGEWYIVTRDNYLMLNTQVKITTTIPKLMFESQTKLGKFEIHWNMWASNISAFLSIFYDTTYSSPSSIYDPPQWQSHSSITNFTMTNYPQPNLEPTSEFYTLNRTLTNVAETPDYYVIDIIGQFNDLAPKGIYNVDIMVYDNRSNYISGPTSYWSESASLFKEVAVGGLWSEVAVYFDKMLGGTYLASIMTINHEVVSSVGFNETFIIGINVTGLAEVNFANASVTFPLPGSIKTYINVTGWHEEYRTYIGGWVYNNTLQNYVWSDNATILMREWVYGPYVEERWIDLNRYQIEANVTRWEYNGTNYNQRIYRERITPKILIFYNNVNASFGSFFAFEYYNDTLIQNHNDEFMVNTVRHVEVKEMPSDLMFYQLLNATKKVDNNQITIEFEGKFTKKLVSDIWLDYHVYSVEREIMPNWDLMHDKARFLAIEKPIINVKIFDAANSEYSFNDYVADPEKWFVVETKIEGSSNIKEDLDGLRIAFNNNNHYWTQNETGWSNLETIVTVNLQDQTCSTEVYNETSKSVYEYGVYETWNSTNNQVEKVEEWRWEYYTLNQSSNEWVKGGLPWRSDNLITNTNYLNVNGYNTSTTTDGKYIVSVNMSFTNEAKDRWFNYDVSLLNWTYGPDYSKPWGEYSSEDWMYTTVYTINNGSEEVYVPKPTEKSFAETSTGEKYLVLSKPFIIINGEKLPLKEIKQWNGYQYEYKLLQEQWDHTTQQPKHYYILGNDTKIYVFEAFNAPIYNLTLSNWAGSNNKSVLASMRWDEGNRYSDKRFIIAINGSMVWLEDGTYIQDATLIDKQPIEFGGYFVLINGTQWMNITEGYFEWDYMKGQNYLQSTNGTKVYLEYDAEQLYAYYFTSGGTRYYVDWPMEYYYGNYLEKPILTTGWCRTTWYYTMLNGKKVEVPFIGSIPQDRQIHWQDLGQTINEGGIVPVDDYINVNGSLYAVSYYEGSDNRGYINVTGEAINVTKSRGLYTSFTNNDVWNITRIGFTLFLANLTEHGTYDLENMIQLQLADQLLYGPEGNVTLSMLNDTSLTAQNRMRVMFYELTINGSVYYVSHLKPFINNIDGNNVFHLLNGSKIKIPMTQKYEISKVISQDIGVNRWPYPETFTWNNEIYNTSLTTDSMDYEISLVYSYYNVEVNGKNYDIVPISVLQKMTNPGDETVPRHPNSNPDSYKDPNSGFSIYSVTLPTEATYVLNPDMKYVMTMRPTWGQPYGWHLQDFTQESYAIKKNTHNIIVGTPTWGLWNYRQFKIIPETGAIDLDGNFDTTDDQFYVRRQYLGKYNNTEIRKGLNVHITYDPNPMIPEDELNVNSWMGATTNTYSNSWSETFYWHYTNMTLVSEETMTNIKETIWNPGNTPKPGYWDISRMTKNMTWDDYLANAQKEGWNWIEKEATWTWLWFGFEQTYWVSEGNNETFQSQNVRLRYEHAGLFIYQDENEDLVMGNGEATHYFMPQAISNVSFITPGVALGDYNATGMRLLPANSSVEFGVSYLGLNGTMYPFGRSYFAWYEGNVSGTDLRTFAERPVGAELEELSFKLHFNTNNSTTNNNSTEAHLKIDQHIGDWKLDIPSNIAVLANMSLSLNYYVFAETSGSWSVKNNNGSTIGSNDIVEASKLSLDTSGLKFADINMGETYVWGGNLTTPYNVSCNTVPLNTFINTFTNYGSETSVSGWTFQSSMCFLSVGFPTWGGRYVYEDPEVVVYLGSERQPLIGSFTNFLSSWIPSIPGGGSYQPPSGGQPDFSFIMHPIFIAALIGGIGAAVFASMRMKRKGIRPEISLPHFS